MRASPNSTATSSHRQAHRVVQSIALGGTAINLMGARALHRRTRRAGRGAFALPPVGVKACNAATGAAIHIRADVHLREAPRRTPGEILEAGTGDPWFTQSAAGPRLHGPGTARAARILRRTTEPHQHHQRCDTKSALPHTTMMRAGAPFHNTIQADPSRESNLGEQSLVATGAWSLSFLAGSFADGVTVWRARRLSLAAVCSPCRAARRAPRS